MTRNTPEFALSKLSHHKSFFSGSLMFKSIRVGGFSGLCAPQNPDDASHTTYDLTYIMPTCTSYVEWNKVSNQVPSGAEAETLTLGHRIEQQKHCMSHNYSNGSLHPF
ncbi:hypothetical protein AVEN_91015-1 [Araneus ventricosus]|uniref:Uncharacterized protein n=1 Tax=Araneus ventricosus TaxID=182803 RepID=A0A4Y2S563_ARAVE|nr:hypothetical protein AVEN_91015-1 [Araneus ventricosus]